MFYRHGPIERWDVSGVTFMKALFEGKTDFNEDISGWDTSSVIDMSHMSPRHVPLRDLVTEARELTRLVGTIRHDVSAQ